MEMADHAEQCAWWESYWLFQTKLQRRKTWRVENEEKNEKEGGYTIQWLLLRMEELIEREMSEHPEYVDLQILHSQLDAKVQK